MFCYSIYISLFEYYPLVFMHGFTGSGRNMELLAEMIHKNNPDIYIRSFDLSHNDMLASALLSVKRQTKKLNELI